MPDYAGDREWADGYWPEIRRIIQANAGAIISIDPADEEADATQATDAVVTCDTGSVAVRCRRDNCRWRDLTLRYRRCAWGVVEFGLQRGYEVDKILGGFGRWYLYCWTDGDSISEWILADLDAVRARGLIELALPENGGREIVNRDRTTSFICISAEDLRNADVLVGWDMRSWGEVAELRRWANAQMAPLQDERSA